MRHPHTPNVTLKKGLCHIVDIITAFLMVQTPKPCRISVLSGSVSVLTHQQIWQLSTVPETRGARDLKLAFCPLETLSASHWPVRAPWKTTWVCADIVLQFGPKRAKRTSPYAHCLQTLFFLPFSCLVNKVHMVYSLNINILQKTPTNAKNIPPFSTTY